MSQHTPFLTGKNRKRDEPIQSPTGRSQQPGMPSSPLYITPQTLQPITPCISNRSTGTMPQPPHPTTETICTVRKGPRRIPYNQCGCMPSRIAPNARPPRREINPIQTTTLNKAFIRLRNLRCWRDFAGNTAFHRPYHSEFRPWETDS